MSHINYNHLYYFWHIYKEGSVVGAAGMLYLAPQTITGWIRAPRERSQGKLFKRKRCGPEPNELGELVFRYADKISTLSREVLDIVNYHKESNLLFSADVVDALLKQLVSSVLGIAAVEDEQIHPCCSESAHEMLSDQLDQHKLGMIISDRPIDSTQQEGLFSVRIGGCSANFWCTKPLSERPFPTCLEEHRLLIPGCRSMLGHKLLNWVNSQGLNIEILDESDDAVLMKAFGVTHNAIFVAPTSYSRNLYVGDSVVEIGRIENVMEEYHIIFARKAIQHPAVRCIRNADYSALFRPQQTYLSQYFRL